MTIRGTVQNWWRTLTGSDSVADTLRTERDADRRKIRTLEERLSEVLERERTRKLVEGHHCPYCGKQWRDEAAGDGVGSPAWNLGHKLPGDKNV